MVVGGCCVGGNNEKLNQLQFDCDVIDDVTLMSHISSEIPLPEVIGQWFFCRSDHVVAPQSNLKIFLKMAFFCARTKYGTDHKNCKSRNKTVHGRSVRGFLSDDNRIKMTINVRCEPPINNMLTSLIIILSLADYCQCFLLLTEVIGGTRLELFQSTNFQKNIESGNFPGNLFESGKYILSGKLP